MASHLSWRCILHHYSGAYFSPSGHFYIRVHHQK
jgi:hypothetical protein